MTYNNELHINYILENFDFEKVREVMFKVNWKWYRDDGAFEVPSTNRLRNTAKRLLENVAEEEHTSCSTGGLFASRINDHLELTFSICDSDSSFVNYDNDNYERDRKNKQRQKKLTNIEESIK